MTVIALASAKGSPGVTTATLALAATWPRAVVCWSRPTRPAATCSAGYGRGALPPAPGLLELATAARRELTADDVLAHSLALDGDGRLRLVAGVTGPGPAGHGRPRRCRRSPRRCARRGGRRTPHDVLVDVGRLDATTVPWALLAGCDLVVLVARPTLRQVRQLRTQLGTLREHLDHDGPQPGLGLLLVGDVPYSAGEVAAAVGLPVLAVLADDPAAARVLSDGDGAPPELRAQPAAALGPAGRPVAAASTATSRRASAPPMTEPSPVVQRSLA